MLDMGRCSLGELKKHRKAMEREACQGERDIKRIHVEVRCCGRRRIRLNGTKRKSTRVRRRCARQMTIAQVRALHSPLQSGYSTGGTT